MRRSIWQASQFTKFYLAIFGIECSQTCLFPISGGDPKFSYDLLKFYDFQCKIAMFTNTSDENYVSWFGSWIHAKKPERKYVAPVQGMLTKQNFWRHLLVRVTNPTSISANHIFINPTSITILSSIPLPRSLSFYHQSCFHLQYAVTDGNTHWYVVTASAAKPRCCCADTCKTLLPNIHIQIKHVCRKPQRNRSEQTPWVLRFPIVLQI